MGQSPQAKPQRVPFAFLGKFGSAARGLRREAGEDGDEALPAPRSETEKLLQVHPRPLLDPRTNLMVLYSAKSACTNVLIWFLHQLGHVQAARDFSRWPHQYRRQVYYHSALYRAACRMPLNRYTVMRVVRDPYERAVSSFRHVLRHDLIKMPSGGLSFAGFLDYLGTQNLAACDPHYALQRHPVEDRVRIDYLINASRDNLFERLNDIEVALGLVRTDLANDPWAAKLTRRHARVLGADRDTDFYRRAFTRDEANNGPWPGHDAFLTDEARSRIARLYAVDINAYL